MHLTDNARSIDNINGLKMPGKLLNNYIIDVGSP
jgi:hypothetical protein